MALDAEKILCGATRARVRFLTPNTVRITHAALDAPDFPPDRPWLSHVLLPGEPPSADASPALSVELANGCVQICAPNGAVIYAEARPPQLRLSRRQRSLTVDIPTLSLEADFERRPQALQLTLALQPGEGFYGWGEQFDAFRRTRGRLRLKSRNAIAQVQPRATYSPLPVFLSSRGYAFCLLNSHESEWLLDPRQGELTISAVGPPADYLVIYGPAWRDIIETYTRLTGRPPLIPRWAFGLMVTGYPQEPQAVVLERVREHRRRNIPLDAIILDYHWQERFHNFRWRRSLIPEPEHLIAELTATGVRLGLILTPFVNHRNRPGQRIVLNTLAGNIPPGCEQDDERDLEGYREALSAGYLVHPDVGWWFGRGGLVDFTNPAAAEWWQMRLRPLYEQGIAFFKNDDGESVPPNGQSALGMDGREYHNLYGFFYSRAMYEGMSRLDDRRPFVYARMAWIGSQRYPAFFLGDQQPTFVHIRHTMRAALNLSLLGFAYWTADVFGLDGRTTPETHARYAQWALLSPVARYFWRPPAADDTRFPWSHGPENEANFRALAELRYRLLPYYYSLAWEAYRTGLPIIRPMLLEFQDDDRLAAVDDQFMLGSCLLAAPVTQAGADRRRIILPAGVWHDFWSPAVYAGGEEIDYAAPLDRLPLLVRGGTILPLGPAMPSIPDVHRFDRLELHIWPPYPAQGILYDDDGLTRAYRRGEYSLTRYLAESDGSRTTVTVAAAEGSFPGQTETRRVEIVLHGAGRPQSVRVNGAPAEWHYADGCVRLPADCPVTCATRVEMA